MLWWFRHDLDTGLISRLDELARREPEVERLDETSLRPDPYLEILGRVADLKRVWAGPAFHFPEEGAGGGAAVVIEVGQRDVLRRYCSEWLDDVSDCQPFVVFLDGGDAVSLCATVRRSDVAEEAGVETHPDFRGKGLAGEVTAAWAREVRRLGRIPLYSTSWTNGASIAVARKLGLIRYAATLHIT
ncbi:MAG: GNAT family N-acetyltransferase [Gemmatimonadota bacterium]|nr:GNAT family N-acetyltransferase [Gemmatimonadota bacterium]